MPQVAESQPVTLKPYLFHGVKLFWRAGEEHAFADCPWCERPGKFAVVMREDHPKASTWRCPACGQGSEHGGGNVFTFLRMLHERSLEVRTDYRELQSHRKLAYPETLQQWGVCRSLLTQNWLVPGYSANGTLCQLYRYLQTEKGWRLIPTPTLSHAFHAAQTFAGIVVDREKPIIDVCEGPWDAMAWYEIATRYKSHGSRLIPTSNPQQSLFAERNIIAVPGCNTFKENWLSLFSGKIVNLFYDSDHPKRDTRTGRELPSAGYSGVRHATKLLLGSSNPPQSVNYLKWGENGYDPDRKSGYDLRDHVTGTV